MEMADTGMSLANQWMIHQILTKKKSNVLLHFPFLKKIKKGKK
ncbi:hypothetical protein OIU78_028848 [Salix suchowensis]|nr:hypothetical protein OIU78_028848 [Salix suchowensis]